MKTFRRDKLRRLAEAGKLVLVDSYHFDDAYGSERSKGEMPVRVGGEYQEGVCRLRRDHFEGAPGRAWENPNGTIHLHVHSNSNYTFRVLP